VPTVALRRGFTLPLVFVPILAASYDGIPPSKTDAGNSL
jgi:DHA2 family multidrug resistance protein